MEPQEPHNNGRGPAEPDRVTSVKERGDGTWDVQTRDTHGRMHVFRGYLDSDGDMELQPVDRAFERVLGRPVEGNGRGR